jgi:Holliday junction DNA helicase RuvA
MISRIQGRLAFKSPEEIVVDVHGVGYGLQVPLSTFYELPDTGDDVRLHVYTHVREDAFLLYGFLTLDEKEAFRRLITVSGVGPRLALNILSGISVKALETALRHEDLPTLVRIPGVGRKTAERMLVELRDKFGRGPSEPVAAVSGTDDYATIKDALSALVNLGYKKSAAEDAMNRAVRTMGADLTIEQLLRESLRLLAHH